MMAVRNWPSLVTNRALLSSLMRIYMGTCFILFIVALWCACVTFLTFRKVKDWGVSIICVDLSVYSAHLNLFQLGGHRHTSLASVLHLHCYFPHALLGSLIPIHIRHFLFNR